jgi:hypothetical protein
MYIFDTGVSFPSGPKIVGYRLSASYNPHTLTALRGTKGNGNRSRRGEGFGF